MSLDTRSRLGAQDRYHAFRWAEIRECLEDVLRILLDEGIRPVLLKGIACVGDLYRPARLRPMRDIDLLVRPEKIRRAGELLRDRGYVHRRDHPPEAYSSHHHLRPFFHPDSGICVELHHRPLAPHAALPGTPDIDSFWKDLRPSNLRGETAPPAGVSALDHAATLEPTLQALITCLHFTHSDSISRRIAHLFDLARTIERRSVAVDWDRLLGFASAPGIARSLAATFEFLAGAGLPSAPPDCLRSLHRKARFEWWERRLLGELFNRYRITIPSPWPRISSRLANILWMNTISPGSPLRRWTDIIRRSVFGPGKDAWVTAPRRSRGGRR